MRGLWNGVTAALSVAALPAMAQDSAHGSGKRAAAEAVFLAALPPSGSERETIDSNEIARLTVLNPGKGDAVRAALQADLTCGEMVKADSTKAVFARVAHALPDDALIDAIGKCQAARKKAFSDAGLRDEAVGSDATESQ